MLPRDLWHATHANRCATVIVSGQIAQRWSCDTRRYDYLLSHVLTWAMLLWYRRQCSSPQQCGSMWTSINSRTSAEAICSRTLLLGAPPPPPPDFFTDHLWCIDSRLLRV